MTTPNPSGNDALTAAVATYRDAMGTAIVRVLSAAYGQNLTQVIADALDERRRAPFLLLRRLGRTVGDVISVSDYPSIVEAHWDLFGQYFSNDRDAIRRMRVVQELVTATTSLSATDAAVGIADIADLVAGVGEPEQAGEVRAHLEAVGSAVNRHEQQADVERHADPGQDEGERRAALGDPASPPRRADQTADDRADDVGGDADRDIIRRQVDELREAQAVLRLDVTTFESTEVAARQSLEASLANLSRAQRDLEARVAEQGEAIAQRVEDRQTNDSRSAGLEQAPRGGLPRVGSVDLGRTRIRGDLLRAVGQWAAIGIVVAVVLHVAGVVELSRWPPGAGSLFTASDVDGPDAPGAATTTRGGNESGSQSVSRSESATPTVPAGATTTATGVVASGSMLPQAFIANTGADGMGPGDDGVGHYRKCVLDDFFRVSETRWPEGTAVSVLEIGKEEDGCFSWLLVGIDGMTTWVREEYLVTRVNGASGAVFGAANTELSGEDVLLKLAIFTDTDNNKHWLFVEGYEEAIPRYLRGERGMTGTSWAGPRGGDWERYSDLAPSGAF